MSIGQRIKQTLAAKGLKATDVENNLGITRQAVYDWIKKGAEPKLSQIEPLAGYLGVDPCWLAFGGQRGAGDPVQDDLLGKIIEAMESGLEASGKSLPPERKAFLLSSLYQLFSGSGRVDRVAILRMVKAIS